MSKKLRDVVIFFAIAFGLTFLASQLPDLAAGTFHTKLLLCGFRPLVSGLICYRLLKTKNAIGISLLGTRPVFSVAVCIVLLTTYCHDGTNQVVRQDVCPNLFSNQLGSLPCCAVRGRATLSQRSAPSYESRAFEHERELRER